jgi:hypothetical protein
VVAAATNRCSKLVDSAGHASLARPTSAARASAEAMRWCAVGGGAPGAAACTWLGGVSHLSGLRPCGVLSVSSVDVNEWLSKRASAQFVASLSALMARTRLPARSGVLPMNLSLAVALGAIARGAAFGRVPCSAGVASNVPSLHSRFPMLGLLFPSLPSRMDARDAPRAIRAAHLSMRSGGSDSAGHRTVITHILTSHARVFVISDLHADYRPNMAWIKSLPSRRADAVAAAGCLSVLLIAGDLASDLDTLEEGLLALKGKFDEVA